MEMVNCMSKCTYKGMCARGVDDSPDTSTKWRYDFFAVGCDGDNGYPNFIPTKEVCHKYQQ